MEKDYPEVRFEPLVGLRQPGRRLVLLTETSGGGQGTAGELLTLDEVAALLKVPKSWIYERTRRKLIPHIKIGKYLRFSREALGRWLQDSAAEGPEQPAARHVEASAAVSRRVGRPLRRAPASDPG